MSELSTKPYLIRALYEWCGDSGYTPYIAVHVDDRTQVPREFVKNGEIVLNVSAIATHRLVIDNEAITFQARFGGVARELWIPIDNVVSIYARETGHGMAFDAPKPDAAPATPPREHSSDRPTLSAVPPQPAAHDEPSEPSPRDPGPAPAAGAGRSHLKRIK